MEEQTGPVEYRRETDNHEATMTREELIQWAEAHATGPMVSPVAVLKLAEEAGKPCPTCEQRMRWAEATMNAPRDGSCPRREPIYYDDGSW